MGEVRPQSEILRAGLIPHRWTRVDDPESVAIVNAYDAIIGGGGPAGLTAAYELSKHGRPCVVLEADPRMVGGISRTDQYKGYRFDIGGHRFFSKSDEINRLWCEILGEAVHHPRPAQPHLLRPQVLPLSAQARRRPLEAGVPALLPHRGELPQGPAGPDQARTQRRGLGRQSLRSRTLRDLLQVVHRESLGDADECDPGRLGRAADQGPGPGPGGDLGPLRPLVVEAGRGDQDLDRPVPVSQARPRPDVGGRPRSDSCPGRVLSTSIAA